MPDHGSNRTKVSTVAQSVSKDGHGWEDCNGIGNEHKPYKWFSEKYTSFAIYFTAGMTSPSEHEWIFSCTISTRQQFYNCWLQGINKGDYESQTTMTEVSVHTRQLLPAFHGCTIGTISINVNLILSYLNICMILWYPMKFDF